jgi:hypothetical protein
MHMHVWYIWIMRSDLEIERKTMKTLEDLIPDLHAGRFRVRAIDLPTFVARAITKVLRNGYRYYVAAKHGGSVCNSYGFPAETETAGVAIAREGDVLWVRYGVGRIPANKATTGGAARSTIGPLYAPFFDRRYSRSRRPNEEEILTDCRSHGERWEIQRDGDTVMVSRDSQTAIVDLY